MPFQPGNKNYEKRAVSRGGRPLKAKKAAAQIVRDMLDANAQRLSNQYIKKAMDKFGDRVLCHAIDKILPNEEVRQPPTINIQFVRFDNSIPVGVVQNGHEKKSEISAPDWLRVTND